MSVNVTVRTSKKGLDLNLIVEKIRHEGYDLSIRYMKSDACEFYLPQLSTCPIGLSKEENGYEVRITSLASREDYELFAKTIVIVKDTVGGNVFLEDCDDESVDDVNQYFDTEWIDQQLESDIILLRTLLKNKPIVAIHADKRHEIGFYGPISIFYVGNELLETLGITESADWRETSDKLIKQFRYSQHSRPADIRRTTTSIRIHFDKEATDNEENKEKTSSLTIYSQNGYDMVSRTDYISLMNTDGEEVIMHYEDFMKIVPEQWERFDNCQYFTTPLTDKQFADLWNKAVEYSIDKTATKLNSNANEDNVSGMTMVQALFFADTDYVRDVVQRQGLPPCAKEEPSKNGEPPLFYAIAKWQEIIFNSDLYAPEYMPVVLEMRSRVKTMVDFWEKEAGIPQWKSIPFQAFSDMLNIPDEEDTVEDIMDFEPQDFRDAGFSNSDLLLYVGALKLDFKRVKELIRAGINPNIRLHPASAEDYTLCTSEDIREKAYDNFQYLYALYKWYLDTGEKVMSPTDCGTIINCAAHLFMYEFLKDQRQRYLKRH